MSTICPSCASEVAPGMLSCPACRQLVHAAKLKDLAAEAARRTEAGDRSAALATWRRALELLPPDSRQHGVVLRTVQELSDEVGGQASAAPVPSPVGPPPRPSEPLLAPGEAPRPAGKGKGAAAVAAVGLLLWNFKFVLGFVATKAKFLLAGLTKSSTLLSMLLSAGVYWTAWGWKFALGVVLSIYVHEMGHVAQLTRYGIAASAPMFIPGFGALVRLKQYPATPVEDARVGLAGPLWGLGAAVVAGLVWLATGEPYWGAVARFGGWVNLFNLMPIRQLDGGRGFRSLTRAQRGLATAAIGLAWFLTAEGLLVLLFLAAAFRCFGNDAPVQRDDRGLWQYVGLVAALAALSVVHVPMPE